MRLTPFGEVVRQIRLRLHLSLKLMAEFMEISSSHLSGIEYGEKRLASKHVESAIAFFTRHKASADELQKLARAAEMSKDIVHTSDLAPDARGLVAAFARRLQEGDSPSPEVLSWIEKRTKNGKPK